MIIKNYCMMVVSKICQNGDPAGNHGKVFHLLCFPFRSF